ncbi:glycerol-3-phosphate 1-O-acyltransferase PlsY [Paenibacillus antri]|uniref:Glycerol-3-phosphate acyltransferase n=1 Tax=Paenibacillus antri TaxID=2582848 RepID=A0A5R9GD96_9BACL|nr:glycerol-3-phosphate 1-O-acyltransferase PlsY [Paenibacillus antri]TLS53079.1 glycerol-3-phosphate 1-O-acyltransferase PlsY [Paenibacillus antri]
MNYVLAVVIGYLIGSISFSFIWGRLFQGIDIRKHGSGNAGATNTLRVMGVGPALTVLALDIAKGVLAVWVGWWLDPVSLLLPILAGFAAIVGHNWPVFFAFRGGKGIATMIGVVATLCFVPGLVAGLVGIASIVVTRFVSLGSLLFAALLPVSLWAFGREPELIVFSLALAALAFYRHRSNIVKLAQGKENKLSFRRSNR